jgi:hypothetical protein
MPNQDRNFFSRRGVISQQDTEQNSSKISLPSGKTVNNNTQSSQLLLAILIEQGKITDKELLYTTHSGLYFENLLNSALILQNDHRFKEDPKFGKMLTDMWFDDLSVKQKQELNKRVVTDKRTLPKSLEDDCFYACPTNVHRNIIHANNFRKHILATHR